MPRLRRQARQKRARPQLAIGVWEWLEGKKTREELPQSTHWDIFVLQKEPGKWRYTEPPDNRVERFWDRIVGAVKAGDLEVSETKVHEFADPPLFPMGEDVAAFSQERLSKKQHATA